MPHSYLDNTACFETILDFLRFGVSEANKAELYYGHGTNNAWDDILFLILRSLSLPYETDSSLFTARLTKNEKIHLAEQLRLRIQSRIPVPYLIHEAYFCDRPFYVDPRVLIPRSPIAELIRKQFSPWIDHDNVTHILDLCTGSGCIAIACAEVFPHALVNAVDISENALQIAEINRARYDLNDRLTLIQSDLWENVPPHQYDIIVSNPPYVSNEEISQLPQEYQHEPTIALKAEQNGLYIVEKILANVYPYLNDKGILVVEVGNSEQTLIDCYPNLPFTWLDFQYGGQGVFLLTKEQLRT